MREVFHNNDEHIDDFCTIEANALLKEGPHYRNTSSVETKVATSADGTIHLNHAVVDCPHKTTQHDTELSSPSQKPVVASCKVNGVINYGVPTSPQATPAVDEPVEYVPDDEICIAEGWCSICNGGDSKSGDLIVFCERCGIPVHQTCYGIQIVPKGDWYCQRCTLSSENSQDIRCSICRLAGGAMKLLRVPGKADEWAHVLCVWWDPDTIVENIQDMEPLKIVRPPKHERQQTCTLCGRPGKRLIQCHWASCNQWFHAICARMGAANELSRLRDPSIKGGGFLHVDVSLPCRVAYHAFCDRHANLTPRFQADHLVDKLLASGLLQSDTKLLAKLHTLRRHPSFDIDQWLSTLLSQLARHADKRMHMKPDGVKEYVKPTLQALQLVLDHWPQLRRTYPSLRLEPHEAVTPEALLEALHQTFDETQSCDVCRVCQQPFLHHDKIWWCSNGHGQHWQCLRQQSSSNHFGKSSSKAKRKQPPPPPVPSQDSDPRMPTFVVPLIKCGFCHASLDSRALMDVETHTDIQSRHHCRPTTASGIMREQDETMAAAMNDEASAAAKPPKLCPPPSDRFRVERATAICRQVMTLIERLLAFQLHPDNDEDRAAIAELFHALLTYVKTFDAYAHDKVEQV